MLTTNHRRLAILYFAFIAVTGFTGLVLATIIRLELAYPGQFFLSQNAERYLTVISLHGIVMVFFVVIPVIFGAFGNFLLPTQLGIRDVAFPRLNSFMFWVTPAGFVMLLHILLFDRAYNVTYWVNYSELRSRLRRRFTTVEAPTTEHHVQALNQTTLGARLLLQRDEIQLAKGRLLHLHGPQLSSRSFDAVGFSFNEFGSLGAVVYGLSKNVKPQYQDTFVLTLVTLKSTLVGALALVKVILCWCVSSLPFGLLQNKEYAQAYSDFIFKKKVMLSKFESFRAVISSDLARADFEPSTQISREGTGLTDRGGVSFTLSADTSANESTQEPVRQFRQAALNAASLLWQHDFLSDWRELKLEREV